MILSSLPQKTLVDFEQEIGNEWTIVNDDVMGGISKSKFIPNKDGHAVFYGVVSLENNGGFASVRRRFDQISIEGYTHAVIKLKGDGKDYQFRVKGSRRESHQYKYEFETTGKWQEVKVPLKKMQPTWRGMRPNIPNFSAETLAEVGFLIANKKNEAFELQIGKIWLE